MTQLPPSLHRHPISSHLSTTPLLLLFLCPLLFSLPSFLLPLFSSILHTPLSSLLLQVVLSSYPRLLGYLTHFCRGVALTFAFKPKHLYICNPGYLSHLFFSGHLSIIACFFAISSLLLQVVLSSYPRLLGYLTHFCRGVALTFAFKPKHLYICNPGYLSHLFFSGHLSIIACFFAISRCFVFKLIHL